MERRLHVSKVSASQIACFSTINAHQRCHLAGFCSFNGNFISLLSFTRGCIDDFIQTGIYRHIDTTNWLVYLKMLIYTKSYVVAPSSLFSVGTATRVILTLLAFLRLNWFLDFCISLKHGLHEGHTLIAPKILVGLLGIGWLSRGSAKGLTILIIAMTDGSCFKVRKDNISSFVAEYPDREFMRLW